MSERTGQRSSGLAGRSVLVVEDHFLMAEDIRNLLEQLGAAVMGPAGSVASALYILETRRPDLAVLDVNLGGETVYAVADRLGAAGVPFVFMTGYDSAGIDPRFCERPHIEKPIHAEVLAQALERISASLPA